MTHMIGPLTKKPIHKINTIIDKGASSVVKIDLKHLQGNQNRIQSFDSAKYNISCHQRIS
jgi:hypothetical protein